MSEATTKTLEREGCYFKIFSFELFSVCRGRIITFLIVLFCFFAQEFNQMRFLLETKKRIEENILNRWKGEANNGRHRKGRSI